MESGQFIGVFSSWEVIASCLFLMFLLPLVFFVASSRSRVRRPAIVRRARPVPAPARARAPAPPASEEDEPSTRDGPRRRTSSTDGADGSP